MPTSYGNSDDVEFDQSLSDLKWDFDNGLLTLNGYAYKTIQRLELEEIHLNWLACRMGTHRESLRHSIRDLKKRSLVNIEVVREKKSIRFFDEEAKLEDLPDSKSTVQDPPNNNNQPATTSTNSPPLPPP
jgi:hypothetical protein